MGQWRGAQKAPKCTRTHTDFSSLTHIGNGVAKWVWGLTRPRFGYLGSSRRWARQPSWESAFTSPPRSPGPAASTSNFLPGPEVLVKEGKAASAIFGKGATFSSSRGEMKEAGPLLARTFLRPPWLEASSHVTWARSLQQAGCESFARWGRKGRRLPMHPWAI